jgi:hypothetical protein
MPIYRLALSVTALSCTALVACGQTACSCPAGASSMSVCGTRLYALGPTFTHLAPISPTPTTPAGRVSPVGHSVIPASMTWAAAMERHLEGVRILTGAGCTNDPMIVVDPVTAFRTVAVARGRDGGIAGITLAELSGKVPTTVRAYRNGRPVGQVVLNPPVPPAPRTPPPPPSPPIVHIVCPTRAPGVPHPMICVRRTLPPDAAGQEPAADAVFGRGPEYRREFRGRDRIG